MPLFHKRRGFNGTLLQWLWYFNTPPQADTGHPRPRGYRRLTVGESTKAGDLINALANVRTSYCKPKSWLFPFGGFIAADVGIKVFPNDRLAYYRKVK